MDCFNHSCPFRVNETSNANRCECVACQNRSNSDFIITSNRTLTFDENDEANALYKASSIYAAIDNAPAADVAPVQKWISVKDRLPEPEQEVLLCTREIETYGRHNEKKKIYRNIYMGYFDGNEWLTFYCHGCVYIFRMNEKFPNETIEVTHWMPSPEPPKEE